jgi:hypothetical protein
MYFIFESFLKFIATKTTQGILNVTLIILDLLGGVV